MGSFLYHIIKHYARIIFKLKLLLRYKRFLIYKQVSIKKELRYLRFKNNAQKMPSAQNNCIIMN